MSTNIKFTLTAIEAKDLLASDSNGFSDPYFKVPHRQNGVVDLPGKKNRSKTIKKNLNPVWNHSFEIEFNPTICNKLNIEVYDYDLLGKDDLIGTGFIALERIISGGQDSFEEWIPLNVTIKDKKANNYGQNIQKGSVHIKILVRSRPLKQTLTQAMPVPQQQMNQPNVQRNQSLPPQQPPISIPNMYPDLSSIKHPMPPQQPPNQQPMPQQLPPQQPPNQQPLPPQMPPQQAMPPQMPPNQQAMPPQMPPNQQAMPPQMPPQQPPNQQPIPPQMLPQQPPHQQPIPPQMPPQQPPHQQPIPPQMPPQQPPHQQPIPPQMYPQQLPNQQPMPPQMPPQQPPNKQPMFPQMPPQQPPNKQQMFPQMPPQQPPHQVPYQQSMVQPQLNRPPTFQQSMRPPMGQPQLQRPPSFQQPVVRPPPIPPAQHSMLPPQIPYGAYPPQPQPIQYSTMPQVNVAMPPPVTTGLPILYNFRNGDALQPGTWIPVREPTVMVGLGWDFTGRETFDLDASVTGFDSDYEVVESIYFSHKKGLSNSVIHYGDNLTGKGEGDDEVIKVILAKVPKRVRYLAVTINSFKKNSLIKAKSAYIRLYTNNFHIGKYILKRTKDCIGLLLGVFERDPTQNIWYFRVMADPIDGNKVTLSYEDIKTLLGTYSMCNAKSYNSQPVQLHPLPGEPVIEFNKWITLANRFTYVGLGWHIQPGFTFDLDASILTFDRMNTLMEVIYHKNGRSFNDSIIHYGDNRSGVGEGDDEVLSVDFARLDPNTVTMAVIVNSFKGNSLVNVLDAFIRLYDTQKPLGVHVFKKCPDCVGIFFGIFRKDMKGVWHFSAIREIVHGVVATESANDVRYLLDKYPLKI